MASIDDASSDEWDSVKPYTTRLLEEAVSKLGVKHDEGKPDMDLVLGGFSRALTEVTKVGTWGAKKYTRGGWETVPNAIERYRSAMLRHNFQEYSGHPNDDDSTFLHAAHVAWNALAVLELMLRKNKI